MDTNQIEAFCDVRYKSVFLSCIPIDGLKDDTVVRELCEHFTIGKFVIFNIDPSDKPGRHWVLLYRLKNGTLFMFDSFRAVITDRVFNFKTFGEPKKAINLDYTPTMKGQLFQYDFVKYVDDYNYDSNYFHTFVFSKRDYRRYVNNNNMSEPLFHFSRFLNALCPQKSQHTVYYFLSQLQPFETIVCGELCILVSEILYRDLQVQRAPQANPFLLTKVSDRIHDLFSSAMTSKSFVNLVKTHMLYIDPTYKVKKQNVDYFRKLFANENKNLVV